MRAGDIDEIWTASRGAWTLEVRWRGKLAIYECRALRTGDPVAAQAVSLAYPHEVLDWLGAWMRQAGGSGPMGSPQAG